MSSQLFFLCRNNVSASDNSDNSEDNRSGIYPTRKNIGNHCKQPTNSCNKRAQCFYRQAMPMCLWSIKHESA